ncbi:MAG: acyl-CoA dehydrogenase [Chloroflexi bacterium]|nr:MAG: acyl-CoA dehydrogenase [Chloroflexota bacterium]TMC30488.1 MAG: acyl-CoA dehydrogenase [Chloroflexota bacterium]TMC36006.1 MAG: acyl-CoA dehydrogenase [Chloroflexota bacterium]
MDLELPEELRLLQSSVRKFVDETLAPHEKEVEEKDEISRSLIAAMGESGLFGIGHDEKWGGQGFGKLGYCVAVEQAGRVNASFWNVVGATSGLCGTAIELGGPDAVRERYLPDLFSGKKVGAYALSEPGAGSDAGSLKTQAKRDGDAYVIDGAKTFITNAPIAEVFVIFANTDPSKGNKGITAFVVERGTKGLEIGKNDEKMGLHGSTTAQLYFHSMRVPGSQRVGDEGQGFKIALGTLDMGRLGLAAHSVGIAQRLLDASAQYAKSRVQFGKPIATNQAIQWMLADAATEIHAARLMVYDAAARADKGERITQRAAMAKLFATEMLGRVADNAVQVHGGMGYMRELWVERAYRDARITRIYEGTSEVQRMVIAGALLENT